MKKIIEENHYKIKKIIKNFLGEYNEDLEQEIYIKTYLNLNKYKEQNKFSSWICAIAKNLCKDYLKSSKFLNSKKTVQDETMINLVQSNLNVEQELNYKERQKIILREVNRLPKKNKQAIILYEFEDYSYEEISNKLKIPIGTVKSRINSARKILSEKLKFLLQEENWWKKY